jgi:hypothetical protein
LSTARKQLCKFGSGRYGAQRCQDIDQLTDIKEVSLLYSAPQRSPQPSVRTEISKMSHRPKQMVATLSGRYRSN